MDKKIKARWLLFNIPSLVITVCGAYILTKDPSLRAVSYLLWFVAAWFGLLGYIIRKTDRGADPNKLGIKKLTTKEQQKVSF